MKEGPVISTIASLIGDPARANMLSSLMDGRALTASELAGTAGVTLQTASGHLAKLTAAGLLAMERQGRHRYFRLSGADVAQALEVLMALAARTGIQRVRSGPRDPALRKARVCYDHLAGASGVALLQSLHARGYITVGQEPEITPEGRGFFADFGMPVEETATGRRPLCRHCLDWSERQHHLGGRLGARLFATMLERDWIRRGEGRVVTFTRPGEAAFAAAFALPSQ